MTQASSEQNLKSVRLRPSYSKQCLIRARHSCRLVRLSPLHFASRMIPSFSVLFLRFCAFCTSCAFPWVFRVLLCVFSAFLCTFSAFFSVLSVRSHGFSLCPLSLFSVSRSDHRLKSRGDGASEFFDGFSLFRGVAFSCCAPPRWHIYKNPPSPCPRNFGKIDFLPPRQNIEPA